MFGSDGKRPVWEYKIVGPSAVEAMNTELLKQKKKPGGFLELFNLLGSEGWELCLMMAKPGSVTINYLFKREK